MKFVWALIQVSDKYVSIENNEKKVYCLISFYYIVIILMHFK